MLNDVRSLKKKYWGYVLGWVFCIYSTLYVMRPVCDFLKRMIPFPFLTDAFIIIILVSLISVLWKKVKIKDPRTYFFLFIVLGAYAYGLTMVAYPEEKIHFVEYGLLGFLTFQALRLHFKGSKSYFLAFILTSLFGWGDEIIQYMLPNRYYQTEDVILNSVSAALGLFLTFTFQRELHH